MNTDSNHCAACGAVIEPTAPGGLCPRCLMAGALKQARSVVEGDS